MNLTNHRRSGNAPTIEETNRPTETASTDPIEVIASFGKSRIGMVANSDAGNRDALSVQRARYGKWQPTPSSEHADGG